MTVQKLDDLLEQFVREGENFPNDLFQTISNEQNIAASIAKLTAMKRDVESQFVAWKSRMQDFWADCEQAKRNGTTIELQVDVVVNGTREKQFLNFPPKEAYSKFAANQYRWKVKNVRFLGRVEDALATLKPMVKTLQA